MFTVTKVAKLNGEGKSQVEAVCVQADSKPTIYANGSICVEMDTSKLYFFDEASATWREWA